MAHGVAPLGDLTGGGVQHPAADRGDVAGLLSQADELLGREQPAWGAANARAPPRPGPRRCAGRPPAGSRCAAAPGHRDAELGPEGRASPFCRASLRRTAGTGPCPRPWPCTSRSRRAAAARLWSDVPGARWATPMLTETTQRRRREERAPERAAIAPRPRRLTDPSSSSTTDDRELVTTEPGDQVWAAHAPVSRPASWTAARRRPRGPASRSRP